MAITASGMARQALSVRVGPARSIAMQIAGPLLAAFSVGKMVQGYISDVAQVAEQTGAYNKKLE